MHQTLAHSSHNCICLLIFLFTIILLKGQLIKRTPVCKRGDSFLLLFTQVFHLSIYTCIYILNPLMDHLFTQSAQQEVSPLSNFVELSGEAPSDAPSLTQTLIDSIGSWLWRRGSIKPASLQHLIMTKIGRSRYVPILL